MGMDPIERHGENKARFSSKVVTMIMAASIDVDCTKQ